MNELRGRLKREHETLVCMTRIYCARNHESENPDPLCPDCRELMSYAERRLERCPYGADKPTCAKCPVHCYKPEPREKARVIMRYAGPRMTWRHPVKSLLHLLDKRRNVEHPLERRRKLKESKRAK